VLLKLDTAFFRGAGSGKTGQKPKPSQGEKAFFMPETRVFSGIIAWKAGKNKPTRAAFCQRRAFYPTEARKE